MDTTDNKNTKINISEINDTIKRLDAKSSIERKIKFLLDVRGYFKVNQINGSYVEFGSFDSKMHYAAFSVLEKTKCFEKYIGLDTFNGEPKFEEIDSNNLFEIEGDFSCDFDDVKNFINSRLGEKGFLVKGDFRKECTIKKINQNLKNSSINLAVIDCNLLSSFRSALKITLKNIKSGGIVYLDDIFTNISNGETVIYDEFFKIIKSKKYKAIDHGFYAPFAKSYIIVK